MAGSTTFLPSADDYAAAMMLSYRRNLRSARFWRFSIGLSLLAAAGMGVWFASLSGDPGDFLIYFPIGLAGAALGILLCHLLALPFARGRSDKLYRQQRSLHHETGFAWDAGGTQWKSPTGEGQFRWEEHHRFAAGRASLLLYLNEGLFHFVPLRALDAGQREDLLATIAASGLRRA